jgi:hypothetical protein
MAFGLERRAYFLGINMNTRNIRASARLVLACCIGAALLPMAAQAKQFPENLGYGLDTLVQSSIALSTGNAPSQLFDGYATEQAAYYGNRAIREADSGRVMVDIMLTGRLSANEVRTAIEARIASFSQVAVDTKYRRTGIIEGYISVDDVPEIAHLKGVRSVFLVLKPDLDSVPTEVDSAAAKNVTGPAPKVIPGDVLNKLGTAFDQGVVQHRVDRINQFYNPAAPVNWDGLGISIAAMSDSYDTRTNPPHAAVGVANFDLPGDPANPINTQPVDVLVDDPAPGTDEGRAMVEIIYKMAPRAKLSFASGFLGEVSFANSIRTLASLPGYTNPNGFAADVIVDDISYGGEPFYGESIIGQAIDDVAAAGVSYFSSAGNNIGINAYESALRIVPNGTGTTAATNSALVGTNIDLTGVPAAVYAGGFHNFNPQAGALDVAQLVNMPTAAQSTEMQWDDPYDQRPLTLDQPPIFSSGGTITSVITTVTFDATTTPVLPVFVQGQPYVIEELATSGNFDGIVNIYDPSNNLVVSQDTGTDETVQFFAPVSGQYKIVIGRYDTTTGDFTLTVNTAQGAGGVTTDLNLLVFRADTGAYISSRSLTTNNVANNRPVELGNIASPTGQTQIQFLIARSNVPTATQLPTRVRWSVRGNGLGGIGPAEYFTYNAVTTKGHATAKGCNGTAAYSVFRANLPESFTSPGPATILFDADANRLAVPEIREVPTVAAADAANNSFFGSESGGDLDVNPNFSGTSAAAPHAAAIAGLILQSRGGPRSVTPADMTKLLQNTAFPHDLDPSAASGTATTSTGTGTVIVTIDSDNDTNNLTGQNDPNSIQVSYVGLGSIASIVFNPNGAAAEGGHVTGGNNGIQDNVGSSPSTVTYFENNFPGLVFQPGNKAFTLGTLSGMAPSDVVVPLSTAPYTGFSNLAPAPSNGTSHFWTMTLGFTPGAFSAGDSLRFTVGRGAQHSATTGSVAAPVPGTTTVNPIADLFGGGVFLPSGTVVSDGMAFSGMMADGSTFSGTIKNNIGHGYSPVDGYGFINAELAIDRIFADGFDQ